MIRRCEYSEIPFEGLESTMRLAERRAGALGRLMARWNWTGCLELQGELARTSLDQLLFWPATDVVANVVFLSVAESTLVV